ncbi:hypothetical protein [Shumkonia mesophila]|uniref:hypothetical protein n=1 Tax=Shumkonia mesophila TaxID=2838854 RepID=UPI002934D79C|nr:hypothetical protein [Shumkonia mesophila]
MSETMTVRPGAVPPAAGTASESHVAIDAPEPWEKWETQLVVWSVGIGIAGLIVLGTLINIFILDKY